MRGLPTAARRRLFLISTTMFIGAASPALAQQATQSGGAALEEVVITATRQEQKLSEVPVSVAAYTQASLDAQSVREIDDIARLTPGLSFTTSSAGTGAVSNISIRGISSSLGAATTGIYIDDTPIQVRALSNASSNFYPQIFDLARVEVLRGPQGTLFGAGAEGGVVRFITPQPSLDSFDGNTRTEAAFTQNGDASYDVGAAVGGPVIKDTLGLRLSADYRRDGGYINRLDTASGLDAEPNGNSNQTYSMRAAVTWKPVEELTVNASLFRQVQLSNESNVFFESLSNPGRGQFNQGHVLPNPESDHATIPTVSLKYETSFADFISTTSWLERSSSTMPDYTNYISDVFFGNPYLYKPGEYSTASITDRQSSISQEFRFQSKPGGPLSWTAGAFITRDAQHGHQENYDPDANALLLRVAGVNVQQALGIPLYNGISLFETDIHSTDKQVAGFGEASYEILPGLKLTAGVRVADTTVDLSRQSAGPVAGTGGNFSASQHETPITPRFGVSYQIDPNNMVYFSDAKGYRVGGANGPLISLCDAALPSLGIAPGGTDVYKSDSVWSYEIGSKNRLLDGKLSIDASAFKIDWSNIQNAISVASCGSSFITNLGTASSKGFDLALNYRPIPSLTLGFQAGYADARLSQTVGTGSTVFGFSGDQIGGAPLQIGGSVRYDFRLLADRRSYIRGDYQYTSKGAAPDLLVAGIDPQSQASEAYSQLSLRAGIELENWDLSIFAKNVLNQAPILSRTRDVPGSPLWFDSTIQPRTIGLTALYIF